MPSVIVPFRTRLTVCSLDSSATPCENACSRRAIALARPHLRKGFAQGRSHELLTPDHLAKYGGFADLEAVLGTREHGDRHGRLHEDVVQALPLGERLLRRRAIWRCVATRASSSRAENGLTR